MLLGLKLVVKGNSAVVFVQVYNTIIYFKYRSWVMGANQFVSIRTSFYFPEAWTGTQTATVPPHLSLLWP